MVDTKLTDLKSMIEFASEQTAKIFRLTGAVYPMYHAISSTGETAILNAPADDKDLSVAMIKAWFELNDIDRYVYIDEAWIVDSSQSGVVLDLEEAQRIGIRNHPDRREVVMFAAENRQGQFRTGSRYILRPETGKPKLSPLKFTKADSSEGRMVGLLKKEKK